MKKAFYTSLLIGLISLGHVVESDAGGLFIPLGGVVNTGRAGAGVVATRDPNAIHYNPALIANTEGHQVLVDLTWAMLQFEYQRASQTEPNGDTTTYKKVSNEAPGITIPQVLFTTDFGSDQFGLGVGLSRLFRHRCVCLRTARSDMSLSILQILSLLRQKSPLHGARIPAFRSVPVFRM